MPPPPPPPPPLRACACACARVLVQYDADELPVYPTRSSHLKGRDAWLVDRVTREVRHAYSQVRTCVGAGGLLSWDSRVCGRVIEPEAPWPRRGHAAAMTAAVLR